VAAAAEVAELDAMEGEDETVPPLTVSGDALSEPEVGSVDDASLDGEAPGGGEPADEGRS